MTMIRRFEHHDEVIDLHGIMTRTWTEVDPRSVPALYPVSYSETFLDMARAIVAAGYRRESA